MTVEEVMDAIKITNIHCSDNIIPWFGFGLGVFMFVLYLVLFIKDIRFPRPFSAVAMVGSILWCVIALWIRLNFPANITLKAEFDPNVVSQEQVAEYFNTSDLKWRDGKIICDLYPNYIAYDKVLEILNDSEGKETSNDV